eukprot:TRINITY_DN13988_c1_g1_i2.p1 TRINITY_DN13988_c1_g1~~TRINITY_DN13988_c1_g1_i2.p1  ORF type:complete len:104 (+),score=16.45 TRINITY_DN13988_c1_g1_i2:218-529(+)
MFEKHPFVLASIAGINCFFLTEAHLLDHRQVLANLSQHETPPRILLIWGKSDIVVDYRHSEAVVALAPERISLKSLEGIGHEALDEDTAPIATAISEFLKSTS